MADFDLTFDGSQIDKQAAAANRALKSIGATFDNVEKSIEKWNAETGKSERVLQGVTAGHKKFEVVIQQLTSVIPKAFVVEQDYNRELSKSEIAANKAAIALEKYGRIVTNLQQREAARAKLATDNKAFIDRERSLGTDALAEKSRLIQGEKDLYFHKQRVAALTEQIRKQDDAQSRRNIAGRLSANSVRQAEYEQLRRQAREQAQRNLEGRYLAHTIRKAELERLATQRRSVEEERALYQAKLRTAALVERLRVQDGAQFRRNVLGRHAASFIRDSEYESLANQRRLQEQRNVAGRLAVHNIRQTEQAHIDARRRAEEYNASLRHLGQTGQRSGRDILLSWRSVVRLFAVQILHQSIAALRRGLEQASKIAFDFSKSVAEIRTISGDTTETTEKWGQALQDISRQQPFKVVEVGEAAYQALSNQVIKTTRDLQFVRDAGNLALVGVSDITTAVNALTSIVNAYDVSVLRSESISATLFKTIELGRTRLEQLEENLGRVTILSAALGVSFAEQQAALVTLTNQGLKDNVAKTLLVNIYNKLIRPSEKMQELFTQWGVSSGESAVATFGLIGVLNKLFMAARESGDSVEFLGETAQRVRATIGLLGLDTYKFGEAFDKLTDSTDEYNDKVKEISESTFVRLKQEFTNLDTLLAQVGTGFNHLLLQISDTFGGFDKILKTFSVTVATLGAVFVSARIIPILLSLGSVVAELGASFAILGSVATLTLTGLATVAGSVVTVLAAAFIAFEADSLLSTLKALDNVNEIKDAFQKLHDRVSEDGKKALREWLAELDATTKHTNQSINIVLSEIEKLIQVIEIDGPKAYKKFAEAAEAFQKHATDVARDQVRDLKDGLNEIEKSIREITSTIEKNETDIKKRTAELAERFILDNVRGKAPEVVAKEFEALGTISGLEEAKKLYDQIAKDIQRSDLDHQIAEDESLRVQREITAEYQKQLDAKIAQQDLDKLQKEIFEDQQKKKEEAIALQEKQQEAFERAKEAFNQFDYKEQKAAIAAEFEGKQTEEIIRDINAELRNRFTNVTGTLLRTAELVGADPKEIAAIERQKKDIIIAIKRETLAEVARLEKDHLQAQFNEQKEDLARRQKQAEDAINDAQQTFVEDQRETVDTLANLYATVAKFTRDNRTAANIDKLTPFLFNLKDALQLENEFAEESSKTVPDQEKINDLVQRRVELFQQIAKLQGALGSDLVGANGQSIETLIKQLGGRSDTLKEAFENQGKAVQALEELAAVYKDIQEKVKAAGLDRDPVETQKANTKSLDALTKEIGKDIGAIADLKAELERQRRGFAAGGYVTGPSGTDRVPAMLTAGEFVVNRNATRDNLPVLQAMNNPRHFARGGHVQNITIGDITVTGGSTSQATARQIARDIKREISRGTLTL